MAIPAYTPRAARVALTRSYPLPGWREAPTFTRGKPLALARGTASRGAYHPDYGLGAIRDTVSKKGTPANVPLRRLVRLYRDSDGQLLRSTWSDATTGAYAFEQLPIESTYTAIAYDYEHAFRAAIADNLTPEVSA